MTTIPTYGTCYYDERVRSAASLGAADGMYRRTSVRVSAAKSERAEQAECAQAPDTGAVSRRSRHLGGARELAVRLTDFVLLCVMLAGVVVACGDWGSALADIVMMVVGGCISWGAAALAGRLHAIRRMS